MSAKRTLAALPLLGAALSVPFAHADSTDDAFIKTLAKVGVSCAAFDNCHGMGNAGLIQLGHSICAEFRDGRSASDVFAGLMKSNVTSDQAQGLMGASVGAYCPEYAHLFN